MLQPNLNFVFNGERINYVESNFNAARISSLIFCALVSVFINVVREI